jgi:hypothetical protein
LYRRQVHGISQVGLVQLLRESSTRDFKQAISADYGAFDMSAGGSGSIPATLPLLPEPQSSPTTQAPLPVPVWSANEDCRIKSSEEEEVVGDV